MWSSGKFWVHNFVKMCLIFNVIFYCYVCCYFPQYYWVLNSKGKIAIELGEIYRRIDCLETVLRGTDSTILNTPAADGASVAGSSWQSCPWTWQCRKRRLWGCSGNPVPLQLRPGGKEWSIKVHPFVLVGVTPSDARCRRSDGRCWQVPSVRFLLTVVQLVLDVLVVDHLHVLQEVLSVPGALRMLYILSIS